MLPEGKIDREADGGGVCPGEDLTNDLLGLSVGCTATVQQRPDHEQSDGHSHPPQGTAVRAKVPAMPSFDVVSQVDMQEVRNAVDQSAREIVNRYDFKGTSTSVALTDNGILLESSAEGRLEAAIDVVKGKLVKRKVSLKAISGGEIKPAAGGRVQASFTLNQGIAQEAAKELSKTVRDSKLKVQVQIQGDQLRVQGKKRDDLQAVIQLLQDLDFRLPLQFVNYRD